MEQASDIVWIDTPQPGWLASDWNISHYIGCALAFLFYIIPGPIFLIAKFVSQNGYRQKLEEADAAQDAVAEALACNVVWSVTHLGGHPLLPFQGRVLIALREGMLGFYDYHLRLFHEVSVHDSQAVTDIRHIQSTSFGTVYKPSDSSFGTSSSTQRITMNPDTLKVALRVKDQPCVAEFDMRPYDPREFITYFNRSRVEN